MIFKKYSFFILLLFGSASAQYTTTDESMTPLQLIENVLINSGCASVSNVSVSGGNFASGEKSWGYFNANGSSFPFTEGVVLSTGKIINTNGPNTFISDDGGGMGWNGDNDLNQALGLNNTFNATILEFDFIPIGNQISFDYIFSSEQYLTNPNPNQCSYTDGFVFLLKEVSGSSYENLAVIPNTNIPVKVNTVRGTGTICPAENEQYFGGFNGGEHPTNFNGQTTILTASATVIPGNQYHIKLVIADEGNYRYDSAIYLKGSSFSIGVNLGNDRTLANQNPVCFNENLTLNGTSNGAQSYQWRFNGNPIIGQTGSTLTFSPPYNSTQNGTYSLATTYSATCTNISEINLDFAPELTIGQNVYSYCDSDSNQDGISTILLNDIVTTLFPNLPSNYQVGFYSSPTSTTLLPNSFQNSTANQQIIYARILNNNCYNNVPVTLNILRFNGTIADETVGICVNIPASLIADSGYQNYLWNTGATTPTIQVAVPGIYTVSFENSSGCSITKTFTVVGSEIATIDDIIINDFSSNNTIEIIASGIGDYEYSIDGLLFQDSPIFTNLNGLQYTAFVRDKKGCGMVSQIFFLVQIPKYFTPNGDGINETWYVENLIQRGLSQSIITIFDRYGKVITQFSGTDFGWDGTYNGRLLFADDYWFTITHLGKLLTKGHFALIR